MKEMNIFFARQNFQRIGGKGGVKLNDRQEKSNRPSNIQVGPLL